MDARKEGLPRNARFSAQVRAPECGRGAGLCGAGRPGVPGWRGVEAPRPESWPGQLGSDLQGRWADWALPGAGRAGLSSRVSATPLSPKQPRLAHLTPFFLTCAVYFLLWVPEDPPSWGGALVKCLPVLSLAGFLRTSPGGDHSTLLQAALLFSALGDICLVWPQAFLHGEPAGPGASSLPDPEPRGPGCRGGQIADSVCRGPGGLPGDGGTATTPGPRAPGLT